MSVEFVGGSLVNAAVTTMEDISPELVLNGRGTTLAFHLTNTGAALTGLQLVAKVRESDASWQTVIAATAWNTIAGLLRWEYTSAGDLNTLGNGASGGAVVDLGPWHAVKLQASCGTTTATAGSVQVRIER